MGSYGLRGAVRVHPFADDPLAWAKLPAWWLGAEGIAPDAWRQTKLTRCRLHVDTLIAELAGVEGRDAAEALKGVLVGVPREALPPAGEDEFYWSDLIGLNVVNQRGEALGRVAALIETGANDVLQVLADDGTERLLPFVAAVVLEVDAAGGCIRVDWEADW